MGKKYFETKTGSLEDVSTKIAKEQPTITKPELNVRLERKTYFDNKPGSLEDAAAKVVSEGLDPVNKVAVKKKFDDRKDKDIDNDGDVDSTDKYLHKRRKAISKSMKEDKFEVTGEVDYFEAPNPKDFEVTVSAKDAAEAKQKVMDKYQKGKKRVSSVGISSVQKVAEDTDNEKIAALRARQMMKQTKVRELDPAKDKDKIDIAKNDIENIEIKMKAIRDKMQKEMLELIDESIKSDDDYQAKKKALQDIQNDPKMRDPETKAALMKRKDKLEKDYAEFKSKDKIAASKEFEKDLVAESPAAKEIDRTNTRPSSMDYKMYKKSAELLRKKDYKALGKHIHKSDTAPREYVMNVINKKEPATFKKIYGNQTGFLATMKPLNMSEADLTKGQIKKVHKMADELPKKDFKDRYGDEKGDAVRYATATNIIKKKEGIKEMQQIDEKIKGIQNKSEKSGIPYGIFKTSVQ